jgi:hypothetical protein
MLNLQTIKHALQEKFKWSNPKEEGSFTSSSANVMAKNALTISPKLIPI